MDNGLKRWECLGCARVFDATADDYCPTCGSPAPDESHIPDGYYFQDDLDGGRLVKKTETPRCVCGHTCDQHANISGCGVCRVRPCPCEAWHDQPKPTECECEGCWRESNRPPAGVMLDPI